MSKDANASAMIILADSREPCPHPWERFLPEGWVLERGTLETGDLALAVLPEAGVVERKTSSDLANCIGKGRERFERELRRCRYVGRMVVVIEGTLSDVAVAARGVHCNAVVGTLAAWTRRYCPFVFCGFERLAADFAFRFLTGQLRGIERLANALRFQSRDNQTKKASRPAAGPGGYSPF
jgi:DNA excision repair protein ERCC-4